MSLFSVRPPPIIIAHTWARNVIKIPAMFIQGNVFASYVRRVWLDDEMQDSPASKSGEVNM